MKFWLVVPAAGTGVRFGSSLPKQYSPLLGSTVIEHCLKRLLGIPSEAIIVALHSEDIAWHGLDIFDNERIRPVSGGRQRGESVLKALNAISAEADDEDWVLVHDVVRPCITQADLNGLIAGVADSPVGGLLATPVNATLKRIVLSTKALPSIDRPEKSVHTGGGDGIRVEGVICETIDREGLWLAATPQMFRYRVLITAINHCLERGITITDEAAAVERLGHQPLIIRGRSDNIKITLAEDLLLAEAILNAQKCTDSKQGVER
ncbi:MAG: 2-C-methyl-D-erythritol 4-phosphate cytidylyltransferase [Gammaproteobacteria bacterium]|nr:MAG: 2-C-methyl-D-erythritol 4-phosphate cytidylyltransferase [Gammaproteobacteria bacterium]RLA54639.1 MAG: 2-C-methyl-D-erythritol 4-phosphate cytidylyltransferase [Gammaproteobacteria bacterium]